MSLIVSECDDCLLRNLKNDYQCRRFIGTSLHSKLFKSHNKYFNNQGKV